MSAWLLPFGLVLVVAAAALLLPIMLRPASSTPSRAESASAVLRDKLAQVARDREAGLIDADEAVGAEAEISRALIAAAREAEDADAGGPRTGGWTGIALIATLSFAASIGIYQLNGSFNAPDQPLAARDLAPAEVAPTLMSEHDGARMNEAVLSLVQRLEDEPGNTENWLLLARTYTTLGDFAGAAAAYARLIELAPAAVALRGDYGEALVRSEGGFVGPTAAENFETVLTQMPDDPRSLYYLALRDAQSGDGMKAVEKFIRILKTSPPDASFRPAIREALDLVIQQEGFDRDALDIPDETAPAVQPGPTAEDVAAAAALPEGEQLEMIRGMVARLEARLEDEPGDIEGWLRLARSRLVLGEPKEGVAALERALAANPGNPDLQAALTDLRAAVPK